MQEYGQVNRDRHLSVFSPSTPNQVTRHKRSNIQPYIAQFHHQFGKSWAFSPKKNRQSRCPPANKRQNSKLIPLLIFQLIQHGSNAYNYCAWPTHRRTNKQKLAPLATIYRTSDDFNNSQHNEWPENHMTAEWLRLTVTETKDHSKQHPTFDGINASHQMP